MANAPHTSQTASARTIECAVWALSPVVLAASGLYLAGPHPAWDATAAPWARLSDTLASLLAALGAGLAAWFLLTASLARLSLVLRARGRAQPRLLGRALRLGAPLVRRAVLGTTSLALVPGLIATTPALADDTSPAPSPPALTLPDDLGWGAPRPPAPTSQPLPTEPGSDADGHSREDGSFRPQHQAPTTPAPAPTSTPATTVSPTAQPSPQPSAPPTPAGPRASTTSPATRDIATAASPTRADTPHAHLPADLGWAATAFATRSAASARPAPATPPREPATTAPTHVVAPGESLWSIAAAHLPDTATMADIDRAWRALYRANAQALTSPSLIHPGQTLTLVSFQES